MPKPALADVREYQGYLAAHGPIAEHETRFLDATDDLVCLADEGNQVSPSSGYQRGTDDGGERQLRLPRRRSIQYSPASRLSFREDTTPEGSSYGEGENENESPVISLSLAMAVAVIAPIMAFGIVPGKCDPFPLSFSSRACHRL